MVDSHDNLTSRNTALRLLALLIAFFHVTAVQASLGGEHASIDSDRGSMHAKHARLLPALGNYEVREMTLPTGTVVREYESMEGVVFAVAWSGPFMPDLRQLMGPHFDTMLARQAGKVHTGSRVVSQHEADLVVESGGHPRSFFGRAYLPGKVPPGVSAKDIR